VLSYDGTFIAKADKFRASAYYPGNPGGTVLSHTLAEANICTDTFWAGLYYGTWEDVGLGCDDGVSYWKVKVDNNGYIGSCSSVRADWIAIGASQCNTFLPYLCVHEGATPTPTTHTPTTAAPIAHSGVHTTTDTTGMVYAMLCLLILVFVM
jgi:hypothetical protein